MKLLLDACSLILLSKALVIDMVVETYEAYTTVHAYGEVMRGKQYMHEDALKIELIHSQAKLNLIKVNERVTERIARDFNMGLGEASIIATAFKDRQLTVVTDNKQGRKAARINKLPLVGSIEIIVDLFRKDKIHHDKAKNALRLLQKEGWFDSYLISRAMEDLK